MRVGFWLVASFAMADAAIAIDWKPCADLADDAARLKCYDAAVEQALPSEGRRAGRWVVRTNRDKVTDELEYTFVTSSVEGHSRAEDPFLLIISCGAGRSPLVAIEWHKYLGTGLTTLTTRYDDSAPEGETLAISRPGTMTVETHYGLGVLRRFLRHARFIARVTPYRSAALTAEFDLTGLRDAIAPHRETCQLAAAP
jgi:type VI secretion system protein VasI